MKKKKKQKLKQALRQHPGILTTLAPLSTDTRIDVVAALPQNAVYIKISGFTETDVMEAYADYLANYLPLLLYNTEVVH